MPSNLTKTDSRFTKRLQRRYAPTGGPLFPGTGGPVSIGITGPLSPESAQWLSPELLLTVDWAAADIPVVHNYLSHFGA